MSKRIALKDYVEVDNVEISNFVRGVTFTSTDDRIDASGFNDSGSSEFLTGARVQEVTLDVIMGRGSNEPHAVLMPLHRDRSEFNFEWMPDGSTGVSSSNPVLRGLVVMPTYGEGATRGELEVTSITLVAADETGLVFHNT